MHSWSLQDVCFSNSVHVVNSGGIPSLAATLRNLEATLHIGQALLASAQSQEHRPALPIIPPSLVSRLNLPDLRLPSPISAVQKVEPEDLRRALRQVPRPTLRSLRPISRLPREPAVTHPPSLPAASRFPPSPPSCRAPAIHRAG